MSFAIDKANMTLRPIERIATVQGGTASTSRTARSSTRSATSAKRASYPTIPGMYGYRREIPDRVHSSVVSAPSRYRGPGWSTKSEASDVKVTRDRMAAIEAFYVMCPDGVMRPRNDDPNMRSDRGWGTIRKANPNVSAVGVLTPARGPRN